jgi:ribosome-binding factor A
MKFTPTLRFELDRVFDEAQHIDSLLREPAVARDLAKDHPEDGS